jgi:hypothetical protein
MRAPKNALLRFPELKNAKIVQVTAWARAKAFLLLRKEAIHYVFSQEKLDFSRFFSHG